MNAPYDHGYDDQAVNMEDGPYRPKVGEPTRLVWGVIIPSYVRESEAPTVKGECVTGPLVNDPAGWYIEYRIAGDSQQYRNFYKYDEVRGPA